MQILLFGKTGQIATEIQCNSHRNNEIVALGRNEADLSKPDVCANIISDSNADVIINAAAYTQVPEDSYENISELARVITNGSNTPYEATRRIEDHLRSNYSFSLSSRRRGLASNGSGGGGGNG